MASEESPPPEPPADGDAPRQRTPYAALDVLQRDHHRLLFAGDDRREPPVNGLYDGFDSRREALMWYQYAGVVTFGRIDERFPARHLTSERALLDLLTGDGESGQQFRRRLVERLDDVCTQAFRDLTGGAREFVSHDVDSRDIDREQERSPAMRPAFRRLDREQSRVLAELWGGFADRRALLVWGREVAGVAAGQVDDGWLRRLSTDPGTPRWMLRDDVAARRQRERFAATKLLPWFVDAAASIDATPKHESPSNLTWKQG
jgi:hypothetical protein